MNKTTVTHMPATSTGAAYRTKMLGTAGWMKTFEKCVPGPLKFIRDQLYFCDIGITCDHLK